MGVEVMGFFISFSCISLSDIMPNSDKEVFEGECITTVV